MTRTNRLSSASPRALALSLAGGALLAFLALVAGCGGSGSSGNQLMNPPPGGSTATISIVSGAFNKGANAYSPNPDTVKAGTTVRWVNNDGMQHTVTSDTGIFDMVVAAGGSQSRQFSAAGSFPYHCRIAGHNMQGTVVVTP